MKLKVRKVEVTPEEFFNALTMILKVDERIPQMVYLGSDLNYICKTTGIKLLEFWKLKFENEEEFEKRFVLRQAGFDQSVFFLWRKEMYDRIPKNKNQEQGT